MQTKPGADERISEVTEYFRVKSEGLDKNARTAYNRAGSALHRAGHTTMEAVCALTDEQLKWMRGVGAGTRAIIEKEIASYRRNRGA